MKVYKSNRKYKCPFCDMSFTRGDMVAHISEEHEDLIPEGFTAARVAFNNLNDTEGPMCQSCGKPTEWNEEKWCYDRIHPTKECIAIARKKALENHKKAFGGKTTLLNDPEHQAKMLANRSISGEYKFADGESLSYVGSYEHRLLEFCDEILHLIANVDIFNIDGTNKDLIINYTYKGKKHFWIPDFYIKPFNLLIDIKDGGDNKNTREMPEYREKQIAKEKAIKDQRKFNYLRLTDNQFGQLLSMFLDIKFSLISDEPTKIHINENGCPGGLPMDPSDQIYHVTYSDTGLVDDGHGMFDRKTGKITISDGNKLEEKDCKEFLSDKKYTISKYTKNNKEEKRSVIKEMITNNQDADVFFFKEFFEDNLLLSYVGEGALEYDNIGAVQLLTEEEKDIMHTGFPIMEEYSKYQAQDMVKDYKHLEIKEDVYGYFVENTYTLKRTLSYNSLEDIKPYVLEYLN